MERLAAFAVGLLIGAAVLFLVLPLAWKYLSPFILSIPFAAMLQPITRLLEKKLKLKHSPATMIPVLLVIAVLLTLFLWFVSYGMGQLVSFLSNAGPLLAEGTGRVRAAINRMLATMETISDSNVAWIQTNANNLISWLTEQLTSGAAWLLSRSVTMASGVPYALIYLNFLLMGIYFVSKDYDSIRARLPGGRYRRGHESRATTALTHSATAGLMGFLRVQGIYAIEVLVVSEIFWQAFGYQYAAVAAIVAGVLEFIPLFGCGALYIPWAVIALIIGDSASALQAVGLYVGLLLIRRLTEPKLMSNNIGVSPLLSLIGMFAGLQAGGILGLIGGPVVMTVLMDVVRGRYLSFVPQDLHTIGAFLRRRWGSMPAFSPEKEEEEEAPAAPQEESADG